MYYKFENVDIFLKKNEHKNFALFYIDLDTKCSFYNILNLLLDKNKNIDCICVLDNLGFKRYCCRRMFLAHLPLIKQIENPYNKSGNYFSID